MKKPIDVLLVTSGTTAGLQRGDKSLVDALTELGVEVACVTSDFSLRNRHWRFFYRDLTLLDLVEAFEVRRATTEALRRYRPSAIVYATSHCAMLQPLRRVGRSTAIRFDSPASLNRRGLKYTLEHVLERRRFRRTALLLPWGVEPREPLLRRLPRRTRTVPLPVPLESCAQRRDGHRLALTYAGNAWKKGLDLVVDAWRRTRPSDARLAITGVAEGAGREFLRARGVEVPDGVSWTGPLSPQEHRALMARADWCIAASRFEDHGLTQLEALAGGAILVTAPSPGPYEALGIAAALDHRLVARDMSAAALAAALDAALGLNDAERAAYRSRAAAAVEPYSRETLKARLEREVLPVLLGNAQ